MNRRHPVLRVAGSTMAVATGLIMLIPIVWMVSASLKPDADIHRDIASLRSLIPTSVTFENYYAVFRRSRLVDAVVNSLAAVLLTAVGGVLINAPAGYAFSRMRFRGRNVLFVLLVAGIILPIEVIAVPLLMTVRVFSGVMHVFGERGWVIAALSVPFMAKAFNIFVMRQYFESLPRSLEEAAFLDGAGFWSVFWRVAMPNAKPAIVTVVLVDVVVGWNDFLWPLLVCRGEATQTVQLGLAGFFTQPPISWGAIMAFALLATLPVMIVFAVGQKWMVQSVAAAGIRE